MKLTKTRLKQIIREEIQNLNEGIDIKKTTMVVQGVMSKYYDKVTTGYFYEVYSIDGILNIKPNVSLMTAVNLIYDGSTVKKINIDTWIEAPEIVKKWFGMKKSKIPKSIKPYDMTTLPINYNDDERDIALKVLKFLKSYVKKYKQDAIKRFGK